MPYERHPSLIEDRSPAAKRLTLEDFRPIFSNENTDYTGNACFSDEEIAIANRIGMPGTKPPQNTRS